MTQRQRKAIGTLLTVVFLAAYSLTMMAVGGRYIVGRGALVELAFFAAAGAAWLPVVMALVRWMSKPQDLNGR